MGPSEIILGVGLANQHDVPNRLSPCPEWSLALVYDISWLQPSAPFQCRDMVAKVNRCLCFLQTIPLFNLWSINTNHTTLWNIFRQFTHRKTNIWDYVLYTLSPVLYTWLHVFGSILIIAVFTAVVVNTEVIHIRHGTNDVPWNCWCSRNDCLLRSGE